MEKECKHLKIETRQSEQLGKCIVNNHENLDCFLAIKQAFKLLHPEANVAPNNECPFYYRGNTDNCPIKK